MTGPAEPTLVDGIDIDAVAAAVRGCPAVDDLDGGLLGGAVTYLPGRRVPGIRIAEDRIEVHVRGVWDQPVSLIASQIRQALATLAAGRVVDVALTDIAEPAWAEPSGPGAEPSGPVTEPSGPGAEPSGPVAEPSEPAGVDAVPGDEAGSPAVLADGTVDPWTTPSASAEPSGGSSSASTTPTAAETRPSS